MNEKNAHRLLPMLNLENRVWYRAIQTRFVATALQTTHTTSRFNPGGSFRLLYLAENHLVALLEVQALMGTPLLPGGPLPNPRYSYTVLNLKVSLTGVADLTARPALAALDTNLQELTGDWVGYQLRNLTTSVKAVPGPAPTQKLGAEIDGNPLLQDIEAFCTLSAKASDQMNLVIFPGKLLPSSYVEFYNSLSGNTERLVRKSGAGQAEIIVR